MVLTILFPISYGMTQTHTDYQVQYQGSLKSIIHQGNIVARVDLTDFKNIPHLFALGARKHLQGEILIMNEKPFISYVQNNEMVIDTSYNHEATLFVYASVDKWTSTPIPGTISSMTELEQYIESVAKDQNIDTAKPFPFRLEGQAISVDWHVIDWEVGDTVHTHKKHRRSGLHGRITEKPVEIVGFYSNSHHGIFTHKHTNMHAHVKTTDNKISGHIDDFVPGDDMILFLPEIK